MSIQVFLGLLLLTTAPILGQTRASAPASSQLSSHQLADERLAEAIRARFERSKIGTNGFAVQVHRGVATLKGRTDVSQHKGVATRLAKLAGARRVDNQIEISDAARKKARESRRRNARRVRVRWYRPSRSERR